MTDYRTILQQELIPALGCTEPIAIALCAAKARQVLGREPERLDLYCSGNVIKNAQSVTVPGTGGQRGISAAAAAGIIGGDAALGLQVLSAMTPDLAERSAAYAAAGNIKVQHIKGVDNLYIKAVAFGGDAVAEATIAGLHDCFISIKRGEEELLVPGGTDPLGDGAPVDRGMCTTDILAFTQGLHFDQDPELASLIDRQIDTNLQIAKEGLAGDWGAGVGKTLLEASPEDLRARIRAYAAAGSDARMAGCALPVVINSGSGNQGMTVSLPLIIYAQETGLPRDQLRRALVLSNLLGIYIKALIGRMSAFCGVVSAAAAAGGGLAWLQGLSEEQLGQVVTNTLLTSGGILCDGAKASCAGKISVALDNALLALEMARRGRSLPLGQGLNAATVDVTIRNVARVAREGMQQTDEQILQLMLDRPEE